MTKGISLHSLECKCFTWSPVLAGALAAIGFSFLLNLFSVAIGLTAYTTNNQGVETLTLGGFIATGLGLVVSMFGSGWFTGYLASRYCNKRHLGAFYGFLTWCLALVITILLVEQVQHYVVYYAHFVSGMPMNNMGGTPVRGVSIPGANTSIPTSSSIVIGSYILFCLFFLSAFACSLGGHCGMRYVNRDERNR